LESINRRCIEKFGNNNCIKTDVKLPDITWAISTLPAYLNWNAITDYHNDISSWITKINDFCHKSNSANFEESLTLGISQPSAASEKTASQVSQAPAAASKKTASQVSRAPAAVSKKTAPQVLRAPAAVSKKTAPQVLRAPAAASKKTVSQASRTPAAVSKKTVSQASRTPAAASTKTASQASRTPEAASKTISKKHKFVNYIEISSEEEEEDDDNHKENAGNMKISEKQVLDPAQLLLFKKGKKLREILLNPQTSNEILTISENSKSEIINVLKELTATRLHLLK